MHNETARTNMIEQQIRPWNVLETQTLDALRRIPREHFVPLEHRHLAFADSTIPLTGHEVMLEPKVTARMVEALSLQPHHRALIIGVGSGYQTALMATLCEHVTAIEIDPTLLTQAQSNLTTANINNITLLPGDAHNGWYTGGPFDAILISGSLPTIPDTWCDTLRPPAPSSLPAHNVVSSPAPLSLAHVVGIQGTPPVMQAIRLTRHQNTITRESLFDTTAPPLRAPPLPPQFHF